MIASAKNTRDQSIVGRLIASLTIGLMMLALGATTAFAGSSIQATRAADAAAAIPTSGPACKVTYGGRITAANGDKATFGGNANAAGPSGQAQFQDHGPVAAMNVHSIAVSAVTCAPDGTAATILGTATVDGAGLVGFQIDVTDLGQPGRSDTYRLLLSTGYDTGVQLLRGGNVRIHKAARAAAATIATATTTASTTAIAPTAATSTTAKAPTTRSAARPVKAEKTVKAPTKVPARSEAATHASQVSHAPQAKGHSN